MSDEKNADTARRRRVPFVFKALALCFLAFVALLILLPAPPEIDAGGVTTVARHVPKLRDTVDPITGNPPQVVGTLTRSIRPPSTPSVAPAPLEPAPVVPPAPAAVPAPAPSVAVNVPAPAPSVAVNVPAPAPPVEQAAPVSPAAPIPDPAPEQVAPAGPAPPNPIRKPGSAGVSEQTTPGGQENQERKLPWRIPGETAALPADPPPAPAPAASDGAGPLPSASDIDGWVKSQAWEFLGGVDAQGNILYRFEVWLDAPANQLKNVKSVAYDYDAPSATPRTRETDRSEGGFRVRFGSLACAKELTVTLTMADGRKQRAKVDGCRVLN